MYLQTAMAQCGHQELKEDEEEAEEDEEDEEEERRIRRSDRRPGRAGSGQSLPRRRAGRNSLCAFLIHQLL